MEILFKFLWLWVQLCIVFMVAALVADKLVQEQQSMRVERLRMEY